MAAYHIAIVLLVLSQGSFLFSRGKAWRQVVDPVYPDQRRNHNRYYDNYHNHNQRYGNITHSLAQFSSMRIYKETLQIFKYKSIHIF